MTCLDVRYAHEDFLDAVYRRRPDGSWLVEADRLPWFDHDLAEAGLMADLTAAIRSATSATAPALVLTCAAIGNHVDHVLTRNAVIRAAGGPGISLELWEDLPYGLAARRIPPLPDSASIGPRMAMGAEDVIWERKHRAIGCYASQIPMFWPDRNFSDQLRRHEKALAGGGPPGRAEAFWPAMAGPRTCRPIR